MGSGARAGDLLRCSLLLLGLVSRHAGAEDDQCSKRGCSVPTDEEQSAVVLDESFGPSLFQLKGSSKAEVATVLAEEGDGSRAGAKAAASVQTSGVHGGAETSDNIFQLLLQTGGDPLAAVAEMQAAGGGVEPFSAWASRTSAAESEAARRFFSEAQKVAVPAWKQAVSTSTAGFWRATETLKAMASDAGQQHDAEAGAARAKVVMAGAALTVLFWILVRFRTPQKGTAKDAALQSANYKAQARSAPLQPPTDLDTWYAYPSPSQTPEVAKSCKETDCDLYL